MKLPFSTIILVVLVLVFSVIFANISNLIAIQVENSLTSYAFNPEELSNEMYNSEFNSDINSKHEVTLNDSYDHLMWFMQVS